MSVREVTTVEEFQAAASGPVVLFFWAAWHEPSKRGGQMDLVFSQLASRHGAEMPFIKVEAEGLPEISERFGISVVPTFVLSAGATAPPAGKIEGADPAEVASKVEAFVASHSGGVMKAAIMPSPVVTAPAETPAVAPASASDIELDPALRARLMRLVNAAPVMLFCKGTPAEPRCKFSRRMVELLQAAGIGFGSFDILGDDTVRQGLKKFSDWPTYPQLYVKGQLAGGIDVIAEMAAAGDLKKALELDEPTGTETAAGAAGAGARAARPASDAQEAKPVEERCRELIKSADVMLFMKGSPEQPRCGFSRQICDILGKQGVAFKTFDILQDNDVREGLKKYSDWPTYPQLYIKEELVGGLDVVRELDNTGELAAMIA